MGQGQLVVAGPARGIGAARFAATLTMALPLRKNKQMKSPPRLRLAIHGGRTYHG